MAGASIRSLWLRVTVLAGCSLFVSGVAWAQDGLTKGCRVPTGETSTAGAIMAGDDVSVRLARLADGRAEVVAEGHGLSMRKIVSPEGAFRLELSWGGDDVKVAGSRSGIEVTRGTTSIRLDPQTHDRDALERSAQLLAGSRAIWAYRNAVARMNASSGNSPEGVALHLADVILRVVQGDTVSLAPPVTPTTGTTGVIQRVATDGDRVPCYRYWEREVIDAWRSYEECFWDFKWYSAIGREVCAMVWVIRAEVAWIEMLTCVGIRR